MKLIISNVSGIPIYEQIKQQIKSAILSGELQAEETLPSLRTLAKDLKISVLTVTKAYTELEQEGFVKNVQGRGCFVMGSGSELNKGSKNGKSIHRGITSPFGHFNGGKNR